MSNLNTYYKNIGISRSLSERKGLNEINIMKSRAENGDNRLKKARSKSFFSKFISNMGDPVIKILLCALLVNIIFSFQNSSWVETIGIGISIFLATFISTMSEHGSQKAFESLSEESEKIFCRVRRIDAKGNPYVDSIPITEVVVGDIVLLESGEKVAADGVLIYGEVWMDQSLLTGESREFHKTKGNKFSSDTSDLCSVFKGSLVISGSGEMKIERVGEHTLLGGISNEIQIEKRESPLKIRLTKLAKQISILGYFAAFMCAFAYLFYTFVIESAWQMPLIYDKIHDARFVFSKLLSAFTLGLTVVVMAVPEGLPMMIAVVLSSNIRKMVKDNVLVRKPVGIEAAGSMNILFTDKTGTLTEGKMSVSKIISGSGMSYGVRECSKKAKKIFDMYKTACFTGESTIVHGKITGGNQTDRALLKSVKDYGFDSDTKVISKIPFNSKYKFSATRVGGKANYSLIKGASEVILPHTKYEFDEEGKKLPFNLDRSLNLLKEFAMQGWRVLALAVDENNMTTEKHFGELTLICYILISDKVRNEAYKSVNSLNQAGISVVMVTGDNKDTAISVAKKCGIYKNQNDICLTSSELSSMDDANLKRILPKLKVVARALPKDKSRLVKISQELGLVVGMTGDGVNDAPALRNSDVGFAMGNGTQVAKEAGDVIILDNNLSSIVNAVLYGRNIFKSIRKFIVLQLTINLCAVGVTMIGPFIGIQSPVTVVQMLWINIIMDTLGGIAFAGEPALMSCMKEKPKKRETPILNGYMANQIAFLGVFTIGLCIAFLKSPLIISHFRGKENEIYHLTAFFAFFIFTGVFNCFNARTDSLNFFRGLGKNKAFVFIILMVMTIQIGFIYLGKSVLRTVPLTLDELLYTMGLALLVFLAEFIWKIVRRLWNKKGGY